MPVGFGDLRPDEHGGLGAGDVPAGFVESFDQHIAAALVIFANLPDAFLRAFEGENARDLNGREGAVVEVTL